MNLSNHSWSYTDISDFVPEEDKLKPKYLIGNCQRHIADLVTDKLFERKCYDYYNGHRDNAEFQHLVDNYGVSHPSKIPFIPIMNKLIKVLVNMQLQNPMDYLVTCQNQESLNLKLETKKRKILDDIQIELKNKLQSNLEKIKDNKEPETKEQQTKWLQTILQNLNKRYGSDWLTDFEVSANAYTQYHIDRYNHKELYNLLTQDLCVTGQLYVRTYIRELGCDPIVERCKVEDIFFDYNDNVIWLENARRVVHRKWMTSVQIINEYGHLIDPDDRVKLDSFLTRYYNDYGKERREILAVDAGAEDIIYDHEFYRNRDNLIAVDHVEWISVNPVKEKNMETLDLVRAKEVNIKEKVRNRQDRYECYCINVGSSIYFGYGKCEFVDRSKDNPYVAKLTYNGYIYRNQQGRPFSMLWSTRDIQNMYDIIHYQLNNLFAIAEPGGLITPIEHFPTAFGNSPEERMIKAKAYRKLGMGHIISLSQEGQEGEFAFNNYGSYQSNLDGNLLRAYMEYLKILEEQAMSIVGLNRQMTGQVEELDGKGTTTMAIKQGELINKDIYFIIGQMIKRTLTNVVNLSRLSLPDGWIGSFTLGNNHQLFSIDAETHQMSDYNVFISDDLEDKERLVKADSLINVAIESGLIDLKTAFDVLMTKSVSKRKQIIDEATDEQNKSASQQLQEMSKQLEALQAQLKEKESIIKSGGLTKVEQEKINLEKEKLKHQKEMDLEKVRLSKTKVESDKDIKTEGLKIEKAQLLDSIQTNDLVNNKKI